MLLCLTYERGHSAEVTRNWFKFDDDNDIIIKFGLNVFI